MFSLLINAITSHFCYIPAFEKVLEKVDGVSIKVLFNWNAIFRDHKRRCRINEKHDIKMNRSSWGDLKLTEALSELFKLKHISNQEMALQHHQITNSIEKHFCWSNYEFY